MKRIVLWAATLLLTTFSAAAQAQDSVTIAAGERYRAGGMKRLFLGDGYRDTWTAPVRVPVLDLDRYAGGLSATEEGGGLGTESLRFRGADGLEYVFRLVDKNAGRALPEDLHGSIVEDISQDLTSAKHPGAALPLPPILQALGILHVTPALYVMPDDPRLGEFREKWRGRLGQVERRLENDLAEVMFPGADDMESTDDFLDELEEDPRNVAEAHSYLKARLVDLWVGDWDRHADQWRWVRFDEPTGTRVWHPVPRDRDNAFVRYEGLIMAIARAQRPNLTRFDETIGPIYPMHYHSAETDRKILTWVERAAWDSVTLWVQTRLTDDLIEQAIGRLLPEYRALDADLIRTVLRARRDELPAASAGLYEMVARDAELHASDEDDRARITRHADGSLEVAFTSEEGPPRRRVFRPGETREVRVYLHGGDDQAEVDGPAVDAIKLRLIGGGGDDRLAEVSPTGGPANARYYDHRGDNEIRDGRGRTDTRAWEGPKHTPLAGTPRDPRDYGSTGSMFTPYGRWQSNVGPVIGVGPSSTAFGFRQFPYARFVHLRAVYAPLVAHGYGVELWGDFRRIGRPSHLTLSLRGNRFESSRFHGFGNASPGGPGLNDYVVRHDFVGAELLLNDSIGRGLTLAFGPTAAWRSPEVGGGTPVTLGPPGADDHLMGGARARLKWDRRDTLAVTRSGAGWTAEALGAGWSDGAPFGRLMTEGRYYMPLIPGGPSLALRAGAEHALGDFPFQDAAWVGGGPRLRGYPDGRFLGESAGWGSVELRQPLGEVRLVVRGRLGAVALADAGRVWVDEESPGGWHTALGGGLWFETLGKMGTLTYAYGERGILYLTLGLPF